LRRWLCHAKNLSATEEEMVCVCEPKVGRNLGDKEEISAENLINFQVVRGGNTDC